MEFVTEVTARLENKPGRLAKICSALAHEKVNIRALSIMDAGEQSVLRLVSDQLDATRRVLTSLGVESESSEVLAVEMDNKPGSLAKVLQRLADEHINIDYAYTSAHGNGRGLGVFHSDNMKKAHQVLLQASSGSSSSDRDGGRRPLHVR